MPATQDALKQGLFVVTGGMACSLLLWFWLNRFLPKMPYFNKLILTNVGDGTATLAPSNSDDSIAIVGDAALAITDLAPAARRGWNRMAM
jgi:hypothetical protein